MRLIFAELKNKSLNRKFDSNNQQIIILKILVKHYNERKNKM